MNLLHTALDNLAPTDWSDVPRESIEGFLTSCLAAGEVICNSVPPPPNGTPFQSSKPHLSQPNGAKSSKDMLPSSARSHPPHAEHEALQSSWGKPMRFNKATNPHDAAVYKMAGHDRHGAWFARRSVHEGMGFTKFKKAMMDEIPSSLSVTGGPGAGAVRGLGGDRRLERIELPSVGRVEVYQMSAQFPGPVTPRDFNTLLLTSDAALTEKSAAGARGGSPAYVPRHYMVVSRPVQHPDAPERPGFVRGKYESVELIREVPLHQPKSKSTPNLLAPKGEAKTGRERGATIAFDMSRGPFAKGEQRDLDGSTAHDDDDVPHDPELNPVEWVMISRSDPGGGIPRFLVERGTPDAMLADLNKFLDWATGMQDMPEMDEDLDKQGLQRTETTDTRDSAVTASENGSAETGTEPLLIRKPSIKPEVPPDHQQGVLSHIQQSLEAGLDVYAPTAVSNYARQYLHPTEPRPMVSSDSDSDSSSAGSFMSAEEVRRQSNARDDPASDPAEAGSLAPSESSSSIVELQNRMRNKEKLNDNEREVLKLVAQRERLDQRLFKKRAEEEARLRKSQEKEQSEQDRAKERLEREMKKTEERHRREVQKLESKTAHEQRKAEEKRRKKVEQTKLSLVSRERDEFRSQLDSYKREVALMIKQVEELQRENTALTRQLGKLGGPEAVKAAQDEAEVDRKDVDSLRSRASTKSVEQAVVKAEGAVAVEIKPS